MNNSNSSDTWGEFSGNAGIEEAPEEKGLRELADGMALGFGIPSAAEGVFSLIKGLINRNAIPELAANAENYLKTKNYEVMSAEKSGLSAKENLQRTQDFKKILNDTGVKYLEVPSMYQGGKETSFLIDHNPANDQEVEALDNLYDKMKSNPFEQDSALVTREGKANIIDLKSGNPQAKLSTDFIRQEANPNGHMIVNGEPFHFPFNFAPIEAKEGDIVGGLQNLKAQGGSTENAFDFIQNMTNELKNSREGVSTNGSLADEYSKRFPLPSQQDVGPASGLTPQGGSNRSEDAMQRALAGL